jgi:EAL domain-containing protein (putative c-di-GMP-specific phosphodiesterase class I)
MLISAKDSQLATARSDRDIETFREDLAAAADRDQLTLNWQPIACVRSGATLGFEALLRWTHPERGRVRPDVFIAFAEDHDLIADIDAWVMARACQEAAAWPAALRCSVNVSANTFLHPDFPAGVRRTLHRFAMDPNRLEVEVTERVVIADVALFADHVRALGAMGSRVVLDDFGTGYSSLGLLGVFPIHKFKLDRSFIRRLGTSSRADTVVRTILKLGADLNVVTCAEGVERDRQLALLQRHGCNEVQGYLIGRPGLLTGQDFHNSVAGEAPHHLTAKPGTWTAATELHRLE